MSLVPYANPRRTTPRRASGTQTHSAYAFPAPQGGIDVSQPLPAGDPMKAIRLENFVPRVLGCQLRKGFVRWVSNLDGEVRSFLKYQPPVGVPQLFAAASSGKVYNVTALHPSSFVPTPVLTVAGGQPPGEWTSFNFVNTAGVHNLVAICPMGGYWTYNGTAWVEHLMGPGSGQTVDGVNPKTFTFATVYQNRMWFIQGGTTRAWYLPTGQISGAATVFDFGAMLPNGGTLAALINWTYDGSSGAGMNNQLVIVSDQGDVLVYTGDVETTPASFKVAGRWYIGRIPAGNRFFSNYQADVIILSERGMCFMSELMRGQGFFQNPQIASAINAALAKEVSQSLDSRYWELRFVPQEQLLVINRAEIDVQNLQWVYEVNNKAFATLRGIPMNTVETFDGLTYCGDLAGNVWQVFNGNSDGAVDDVPGTDIQGLCVTSFQPMGEGIRVKRFLMVRPSFISDSAPGIQAILNKEWAMGVPSNMSPYLGAGENFWDVGLWSSAVWSGEGQSYESWIGANGSGRYASLALRVRGAADTLFVGWQALVESGGVL